MFTDRDPPLLDELLHRLFTLEGDEAEAFPGLRLFVDGHLEVGDLPELAEELLQHFVRQFWLEAADKDFA